MNDVLLKIPDAALEKGHMMLERARWGATRFQKLDRTATQRIVNAVAAAAFEKSQTYAEWAVRETGMGVVAHKRFKNEACSKGLVAHYAGEDFVGSRIDAGAKIVELPRPAGVVFALLPATSPVATVYFKTLLALMTRNAIILSPHPSAKACCADVARMMMETAKAAGAPDGVIQVLEEPNIPLIEKLMCDERVDLVLSTGGLSVVKASYRTGNPALAAGPGNAPAIVDDTAAINRAAKRIVESKSFDNSIMCTTESVVLAFNSIAEELLGALKAEGAHICTEEEIVKLRKLLFTHSGFNTAMIGKDASFIAREAGFAAPNAKILVTQVTTVQPEEKLVREKLCPVLAFAKVSDIDQAISAARSMMRHSGHGHSAAIHSKSETNILRVAAALPALRLAVNVGCALGASGFETHLGPSIMIGTGFEGGSSLSENLTPHHLLQFTRIAYNKAADEAFGNFI